jgi:hypothetical protein
MTGGIQTARRPTRQPSPSAMTRNFQVRTKGVS